jgi:L-lactate dehydrogenase
MNDKVAIIGVGAVGRACASSMLLRGSCRELVLLDARTEIRDDKVFRLDHGVATDLSHGAQLCPPVRIMNGDYSDMADVGLIVITAGHNERDGGAVDRTDPQGRLRLLEHNARVYAEIVPNIAASAPNALILVVTDPPDPLADVTRKFTDTNPVLSSGTFLDTLRFRLQLSKVLCCNPASVDALVIGEHGTSQVYLWSSARVGGVRVLDLAERLGNDPNELKEQVESAVRYANIEIIEGTGASQHGIGIVTARIVEAILRDEGLVAPIGILDTQRFPVTLSLPVVLSRKGYSRVLMPPLTLEEERALDHSANVIKGALAKLPAQLRP